MSNATMRAVSCVVGQPLGLHDLPRPEAGPEQILIRVAAAGVNRPDMIQRAGKYPPPPGAPETLGLEVSGWVDALGDGAADAGFKIGDPVIALVPGGGYAEYAIAHKGSVLPVPEPLTMEEAAGLPETVFTVWNNVFDIGRLQPGERLLVHGGASGIGTTAIQLAAAWGATVFVTAGSDDKCRQCEQLGAKRGINYREEDFEAILNEAGGVDVVLDMVGAPYFTKNLSILNDLGRLVYIAFLHGAKLENADISRIMMKRLTVTGSTLRIRTDAYKAALAAQVHEHVWPMIAEGKFRPVVEEIFDISMAEDAHARMDSGGHVGKVILKVGDK